MPRFWQNVIANFGGQTAATVIAMITVPLYMRYLGPEGFGLAGFLLTLQAFASILDFGLSTAANREISRHRAQERALTEQRDLVRTLEVFYLVVAGAIFVGGIVAAPWLATHWFSQRAFDIATLRTCLILGSGSVALRWPTSLYQGVLRGLEKQVELNTLNAFCALLRGAGTVAVLVFVSGKIIYFFEWQVIFSVIEVVLFAVITWQHLPLLAARSSPRFRWRLLYQMWGYSAQVGGLSLFAMLLKQLDKILISRLLPIEQLGYYNAASLASGGLSKVVQPMQAAAFPRLSGLHARHDTMGISSLFHQSCQTAAFLVCPFACTLLFFAPDILLAWTGSVQVAQEAGPTLAILSVAMLLNSQMNMVFALQLAAGMAWLPLAANALGVVVLGPALLGLVQTYGLIGAAFAWLAYNLANFAIVPVLTLRRLLPGEYWRWLLQDSLPFILAALTCFGLARYVSVNGPLYGKALGIGGACVGYISITMCISPEVRRRVRRATTHISSLHI